jgi:hypothetical protein
LEYWDAARSRPTILKQSLVIQELIQVKLKLLYKDFEKLINSFKNSFKIVFKRSTVSINLPN